MKISPLAPGANVAPTQAPSVDKIARAKVIAAGGTPEEQQQSSGDPQADRTTQALKKIKMRTQVSPDRGVETTNPKIEASTEVVENPTADVVEPTSEVVEETKPLSPQFAALAKRQRALQVKERELAQREAALTQNTSVNTDEYVSKADLLANPLKVFDAGVTYDQLTEAILANQNGVSPEINQLKADLKALKEELTGQLNQRDQLQEQQVLAELSREAKALVATEAEQYEAIKQARAEPVVVDLIHRTWKQTGEVLDVREAAELVENQLIEEALPFAQIKKVQSRLTPAQAEVIEAQIEAPKPGVKIMRTLTNRDSARPTALDRRSRALAAFNGTLKKG